MDPSSITRTSLEYLKKLPHNYRLAANPSSGWDDGNDNSDAASSGSFSWRTFSTSSAPSTLLSFYRDAHLFVVGRYINRLGKLIVNPIDNEMARRELGRIFDYIAALETDDDWATARRIFQSDEITKGLLEAGR
jgi:hypothetical protein